MKAFKKFFYTYLFLFASFINAEIINEIKINGLDTISRGTVLEYLALETGDTYSTEIANNSIRNLFETDFFSKVSVNFINNILVIDVEENPTIKYVDFLDYANDEVLSDSKISEIKTIYQLDTGKIYLKKNFDNLIRDLKSLYVNNGYYKTKIYSKVDIDNNNRIGIELIFEENDPVKISSLKIDGNEKFVDDELLDLFEIGEPDFFLINYFTEKDKFSKTKFAAGLETLKSKYLGEGFLDFSVTDTKTIYNDSSNSLEILISVNEGSQYVVNQIEIKGELLNFSAKELRNQIDVVEGDIFYRNKIVAGVNNIVELFQDSGYAFAQVSSEIKNLPNSNKLDVNIIVDPNSIVYVDRIVISGNNITQDDVIRRKLKIDESQLYTKKQIIESIRSIKRLGFFSSVEYDIKRHLNDKNKVDIFIDVVETKTGEFSIGLSHANATGASINAGISQKNILGTGNTLRANISNSDALKQTSLFFEDPYFNNKQHSISYGFFSKSLDASNIDASAYVFDESGITFGYGVPLSEFSRIFGEFKFSTLDLVCGSDLKNLYEVNQCASNDDIDTSISLKFSSNSLDDFYFPSSGDASSVKTTLGLPTGDFKYIQLDTSFKNFTPVFTDKVLGLSAKLNYAQSYGNDDLPFFKRYYGGGASSVRGFDFNSLGAKYSNDKPKGGELSFVSSVGLSSKLDFIGIENNNMRITGFVDAGTISETLSSFKVDDIRASVGTQFSWLTPIGPIGLNFAQPIIKKADDKTETFAFELGSTF